MDFQSIALPSELRYLCVLEQNCLLIAGANIDAFLIYPKQILKKMNYYLCFNKYKRMILALDVGNTRIKSAVFESNKLIELMVFENSELQKKIILFLKKYPSIQKLVIASVGKLEKNDFNFLPNGITIEWIDSNYVFPFTNKYATPTTLGVDRMILASGAVLQFPNQNRLVIDAGTCITYDFINDKDEYLGGAIALGLQMRYKALNNFTSKLP